VKSASAFLIAVLMPSALFAAPASNEADEGHFVSAFIAICLENMGDAKGQETAAIKAPLAFAKGAGDSDGLREYLSGPYRLGIGEALQQCTLTRELASGSSLNSVISTMANAIGTDQGQELEEPDSRYWLIAGPADEEFVLAIKVSNKSDKRLATLWVQRRSGLSQSDSKAN
jgi:hypothetical protein